MNTNDDNHTRTSRRRLAVSFGLVIGAGAIAFGLSPAAQADSGAISDFEVSCYATNGGFSSERVGKLGRDRMEHCTHVDLHTNYGFFDAPRRPVGEPQRSPDLTDSFEQRCIRNGGTFTVGQRIDNDREEWCKTVEHYLYRGFYDDDITSVPKKVGNQGQAPVQSPR